MADGQRVVEIILRLKDQISKDFDKAAKSVDNYHLAAERLKGIRIFEEVKKDLKDSAILWKTSEKTVKLYNSTVAQTEAILKTQAQSIENLSQRKKGLTTLIKQEEEKIKSLGKSLDTNAISQDKYNRKLGELKNSLATQKAALDKAKQASSSYSKETENLKTRQDGLKILIASSAKELKTLSSAYKKGEISETAFKNASNAVQDSLAKKNVSLSLVKRRLEELKGSQKQSTANEKKYQSAVKGTEAEINKLSGSFKKQGMTQKEYDSRLKASRGNIVRYSNDLNTVEQSLTKLGISQKQTTQLFKQQSEITKKAATTSEKLKENYKGVRLTLKTLLDELIRLGFGFNTAGQAEKKAAQQVRKFGEEAFKTAKGVEFFKNSLKGIKDSLSDIGISLAVIGGALSAAFTSAIKTSLEFEDSMAAVSAITSASSSEIQNMTSVVEELGRTTRFTAQEAAEGLRRLGMAGLDASESIKALPSVLQLSAAGALDFSRAADISTNIMSGYGLEAEDLTRVNDILVQGMTNTNSTLEELGVAFSYVGPIAKSTGLSFEDTATALGMLHNAGIKGSMAGTTLRGTLLRLENPSKKAAALLQELGQRIGQSSIEMRDATGNFVGMSSLLQQFKDAALTSGEAALIFGQRAGPGMAGLIAQGIPAYDEMLSKMHDSEGRAKFVADTMESTLGGAFRRLKSAIDGFSKSVGDDLNGLLEGFANVAAKMVNAVTSVKESLGPLGSIFSVLTGGAAFFTAGLAGLALSITHLGPGLSVLGNQLKVFKLHLMAAGIAASSNITGVTSLRLAYEGLITIVKDAGATFIAFMTTVPGIIVGVVAAIGGLVAAYYALRTTIEETIKKQEEIIGQTSRAAGAIKRYTKDIQGVDKRSKEFTDSNKTLRTSLEKTSKGTSLLAKQAGIAAKSINKLTGELNDGGEALRKFNEEATKVELEQIAKQAANVSEKVAKELERMYNPGSWQRLVNIASTSWDAVAGIGVKAIGAVLDKLDSIGGDEKAAKNIDNIKESWEELLVIAGGRGLVEPTEEFKKAIQSAGDLAEKMFKKMQEAGQIDFNASNEAVASMVLNLRKGQKDAEIVSKAFVHHFEQTKKEIKELAITTATELKRRLDPDYVKEQMESISKIEKAGLEILNKDWMIGSLSVQNVNEELNEKLRQTYIKRFKNLNDESKKGFIKQWKVYEEDVQAVLNSEFDKAEKTKVLRLRNIEFLKQIQEMETKQEVEAVTGRFKARLTEVKSKLEAEKNLIELNLAQGKITAQEANDAMRVVTKVFLDEQLRLAQENFDAIKKLHEPDTTAYDNAQKILLKIQKKVNKERVESAKEAVEQFKKVYESEVDIVVSGYDKRFTELEKAHARGLSSEEEYVAAVTKLNDEKYNELIKKAIDHVKQLQQMDDARESDVVAANQKLDALYKEYAQKNIKNIEDANKAHADILKRRVEAVEKSLEDEISAIELAKSKGLITEGKAQEEIYQLQTKAYSKQLSLAKKNAEDISKVHKEGSKEYTDAQKLILSIQKKINDSVIQNEQAANKRKKDLREAEADSLKADYDIKISLIEKKEQEGRISHAKAAKQKIEAELDFLEFKVEQTKIAVEEAIVLYGKDTAEYIKAVTAKKNAEASLNSAKEASKNTIKSAIELDKESGRVTEKVLQKKDYENTVLGENIQKRKGNTVATDENTKTVKKNNEASGKTIPIISGVSAKLDELTGRLKEATKGFSELIGDFQTLKAPLDEFGKDVTEKAITNIEVLSKATGSIISELYDNIKKGGTTAITAVEDSIESLRSIYDKYAENLDSLKEKNEELNEKIKDLAEERKELEEDNADFLENIQAEVTGNLEKEIRAREKYDKAYSQGQEALRKGEFEIAKEYFLKARDLTEDMLKDVESFRDKILGIEKDTAETIRDLQQGLMTDLQKWRDDKAYADSLAAQAREAQIRGEIELSAELFKEAQDMYAGLAREVKDHEGNVVKSLEQTTSVALEGVRLTGEEATKVLGDHVQVIEKNNEEAISLANQAANAASNAMQKYSDKLTEQQKQNEEAIEATQGQINQLIDKMNDLAEVINQELVVDIKTAAAEAALDKLAEVYGGKMALIMKQIAETTSRLDDVRQQGGFYAGEIRDVLRRDITNLGKELGRVNNQMTNANALMEDFKNRAQQTNRTLQNTISSSYFNEGGQAGELSNGFNATATRISDDNKNILFGRSGYSSGGKLPGFGTRDTVPAMLTPGEYITNARSSRVIDYALPGFMPELNRVKTLPDISDLFAKFRAGFNSGGKVGTPIVQKFAGGGQVLDTSYVSSVISILTAALKNLVPGGISPEEYYEKEEKLREKRLKQVERAYESETLFLALSVAKGEKTEDEANKEKLEGQIILNRRMMNLANERVRQAIRLFGRESEQFEEAMDKKLKIQSDINWLMVEKAKQATAERERLEAEALRRTIEAYEESRDARLDAIEAAYNRENLAIAFAEAKGEIESDEANKAQLANKMKFYQDSLALAKSNIGEVGKIYGQESSEYEAAQDEIARIQNDINWLLVDQAKLAQQAKEAVGRDSGVSTDEEESAKDKIKRIYEDKLKAIQDTYNEQTVALELALAKGEITEQEAAEKSLGYQVQRNKAVLKAATENQQEVSKLYGEDSDEYRAAQDDITEAALQSKWLDVDKAKLVAKQENEAVIKAYEDRVSKINNLYNQQAKDIELALARNEMSEQEAADKIAQLNLDKNKDILAATDERLKDVDNLFGSESDQYKAALQLQLDAQIQLDDAKIASMQQAAKKAEDIRQADLALTEQQNADKLALINAHEKMGIISQAEANEERAKLDFEYVEKAKEAAQTKYEDALRLYGLDSLEYKNALAEKMAADRLYFEKSLAYTAFQEGAGTISHREAIDKKKEAEIEFLDDRLKSIYVSNKELSIAYDQDSQEYEDYLNEKKKALREFNNLRDEVIARSDQDYLTEEASGGGGGSTAGSGGGYTSGGGVGGGLPIDIQSDKGTQRINERLEKQKKEEDERVAAIAAESVENNPAFVGIQESVSDLVDSVLEKSRLSKSQEDIFSPFEAELQRVVDILAVDKDSEDFKDINLDSQVFDLLIEQLGEIQRDSFKAYGGGSKVRDAADEMRRSLDDIFDSFSESGLKNIGSVIENQLTSEEVQKAVVPTTALPDIGVKETKAEKEDPPPKMATVELVVNDKKYDAAMPEEEANDFWNTMQAAQRNSN